ncbi:MAG: plasmid pRiA4b ORF-3 family protein [Nodosilinea sp.]
MFYDLYVDLLDSDPAIWRQLRLRSTLGLAELHRILIATMGWSGLRDYTFRSLGSAPAADDLTGTTPLDQLLSRQGDSLLYIYDAARGWRHKIILESILTLPAESDQGSVLCLAGEGSGPPEFCEGVWGYGELLERLNDHDDPEYDQLWQQVGYDFDPYAFNLDTLNQQLRGMPWL